MTSNIFMNLALSTLKIIYLHVSTQQNYINEVLFLNSPNINLPSCLVLPTPVPAKYLKQAKD